MFHIENQYKKTNPNSSVVTKQFGFACFGGDRREGAAGSRSWILQSIPNSFGGHALQNPSVTVPKRSTGAFWNCVRLPLYISTKQRRHPLGCLLCLVEMRGVEPLSENRSMRLSPGAASDQISLWTTSGARSDTGSHFVRDRLNGEPPMHGHRYMTFSLGSRYSRGERAAL